MSFYNNLTSQNQLSFDFETDFKLQVDNSYYFGGNAGIGKTTTVLQHAKHFINHTEVDNDWQDRNMQFIKFSDIVKIARNCFVDGDQGWNNRQQLKQIKECFYLIIDDIGTEKQTEFVDQLIYDIIDWRYENNCITLFTSNYALTEVRQKYHERIASRILGICGQNNVFYKEDGTDKRFAKKKTVSLEAICEKNKITNEAKTKQPKVDPVSVCQNILIGIAKSNPKLINKILTGQADSWMVKIAKQSGLESPEEVILLLQTSKEFAQI
jgi:hypothetical protein